MDIGIQKELLSLVTEFIEWQAQIATEIKNLKLEVRNFLSQPKPNKPNEKTKLKQASWEADRKSEPSSKPEPE